MVICVFQHPQVAYRQTISRDYLVSARFTNTWHNSANQSDRCSPDYLGLGQCTTPTNCLKKAWHRGLFDMLQTCNFTNLEKRQMQITCYEYLWYTSTDHWMEVQEFWCFTCVNVSFFWRPQWKIFTEQLIAQSWPKPTEMFPQWMMKYSL